MTKDQFIELAIEMANQQVTADTDMHPEYAAKALSTAMGRFVVARIFNDLKEGGDKDVALSICKRFFATTSWDRDTQRYIVDMPYRVVKLPKERGLQYVGPKVGQENMYTIMRGITGEKIVDPFLMQFTNEVFVRMEGPKRLVFKNLSGVCEVMIMSVPEVDDLAGDDEVLCPSEFEADVLNYMVQVITGKKRFPDDDKPDNNEDK